MQIEEKDPYGPTSREEIAQLETRWKIKLPDEYKKFLLTSNGGRPNPDVFDVPGWAHQGSVLKIFYGIHAGSKASRLDRAIEVYTDRIPADLIPIAADSFGNAICLGWKGKRRGKVYFWDHEDELDEHGRFRQDYGNVYLIAKSLMEFLNSLRESEDAECE